MTEHRAFRHGDVLLYAAGASGKSWFWDEFVRTQEQTCALCDNEAQRPAEVIVGAEITGHHLNAFFLDELRALDMAPNPQAEEPPPKRKQHGPVIKGKKGKIRRW